MKQILPLAALALFTSSSFSQILNGGFETWVANGQNCQGPENWGTLNTSTGIVGVCTAEQESTDVHGGSFALKLSTQQVVIPPFINETAPGIVTNGTVNTQTEEVEGGHAFSAQPAAFSFWYKASPVNQDLYSFSALLIDEISGDTVGYAEAADTAIVESYTEVVADIAYVSSTPPTLLQVIFLPSNPSNPQIGSTLWIDDFTAVGDVSGLSEAELADIYVYPNPVTDKIFFNLGSLNAGFVSVYNVLGLRVAEESISSMNNSVDLSRFSNGTYIWQLADDKGELIKTGRLLLAK
jgi:hypothetical protein